MGNMARTDRSPRRRLDPAERREVILAAAAEAFGQRAYDEVGVAAVAEGAGASEALVYRYFTGKAELYAAVLARAGEAFRARRDAAVADLPDGVPVRDRVRALTLVTIEEVAANPAGWASPVRHPAGEPDTAEEVRRAGRAAEVDALRAILLPRTTARHDYALTAWFGFLDAACARWAARGCPATERWSIIDAALGALQGALGDWAA